jgi:hypothetical protein
MMEGAAFGCTTHTCSRLGCVISTIKYANSHPPDSPLNASACTVAFPWT